MIVVYEAFCAIVLCIALSGLMIFTTGVTNKKIKIVNSIIFVIVVALLVSFSINTRHAEHYDNKTLKEEYEIHKLVANGCYIDLNGNDYKCSFSESFVELKVPRDNFNNVVILEKETWKTKWLGIFEVVHEDIMYNVYLTKEMYDRVLDGNIYFDLERGNLP